MKWRLAVGISLMLASIPCFALGGVIIMKTMDQSRRAASQALVTDKQCRERLATIGTIKESNDTITLTVRNVQDPRKALTDASIAQSLCPQRTLAEICLGEACEPNSKSVTLRLQLQAGRAK